MTVYNLSLLLFIHLTHSPLALDCIHWFVLKKSLERTQFNIIYIMPAQSGVNCATCIPQLAHGFSFRHMHHPSFWQMCLIFCISRYFVFFHRAKVRLTSSGVASESILFMSFVNLEPVILNYPFLHTVYLTTSIFNILK